MCFLSFFFAIILLFIIWLTWSLLNGFKEAYFFQKNTYVSNIIKYEDNISELSLINRVITDFNFLNKYTHLFPYRKKVFDKIIFVILYNDNEPVYYKKTNIYFIPFFKKYAIYININGIKKNNVTEKDLAYLIRIQFTNIYNLIIYNSDKKEIRNNIWSKIK